jgi:hypothetical protein
MFVRSYLTRKQEMKSDTKQKCTRGMTKTDTACKVQRHGLLAKLTENTIIKMSDKEINNVN